MDENLLLVGLRNKRFQFFVTTRKHFLELPFKMTKAKRLTKNTVIPDVCIEKVKPIQILAKIISFLTHFIRIKIVGM